MTFGTICAIIYLYITLTCPIEGKQLNDKEFEDYSRSMQEMFRSEGWEYFLSDLRGSVPNVNSVEAAKDLTDLFFRKGQLAIMANILNLEAQLESVVEERSNPQNSNQEEAA